MENPMQVNYFLTGNHNIPGNNIFRICEFKFWYSYFTDTAAPENLYFFESDLESWPSIATFEGYRNPGYPSLIYDSIIDQSINGIVSLADAALHTLHRKGSFDFHSQSAIRTVRYLHMILPPETEQGPFIIGPFITGSFYHSPCINRPFCHKAL